MAEAVGNQDAIGIIIIIIIQAHSTAGTRGTLTADAEVVRSFIILIGEVSFSKLMWRFIRPILRKFLNLF